MAEIKEKQNRIFPAGKLVSALSWLTLIGSLIMIGRLAIIFAMSFPDAKGISTVFSIFLFVLNVAFACILFVLACRSSIFIFAGIGLLLASTTDLFIFSKGLTSATIVFFIVLPIYLILFAAFLISLSKGMQACADSSGGESYYNWPPYRKTVIFLYATFLLVLLFFKTPFGIAAVFDFELPFKILFALLLIACHAISFWQFVLLRKTAKELIEPTKSSR